MECFEFVLKLNNLIYGSYKIYFIYTDFLFSSPRIWFEKMIATKILILSEKETQKGKMKNTRVQKFKRCEKCKDVKLYKCKIQKM